MIRTLALSLFVGYTTTLPPPHQRLSSYGLFGSKVSVVDRSRQNALVLIDRVFVVGGSAPRSTR